MPSRTWSRSRARASFLFLYLNLYRWNHFDMTNSPKLGALVPGVDVKVRRRAKSEWWSG